MHCVGSVTSEGVLRAGVQWLCLICVSQAGALLLLAAGSGRLGMARPSMLETHMRLSCHSLYNVAVLFDCCV